VRGLVRPQESLRPTRHENWGEGLDDEQAGDLTIEPPGRMAFCPIRSLEAETYVPPLDIYMDGLQVAFRDRLKRSGQDGIIANACQTIRRRLLNRRGRPPKQAEHYGADRAQWAEKWLSGPTKPSRTTGKSTHAEPVLPHPTGAHPRLESKMDSNLPEPRMGRNRDASVRADPRPTQQPPEGRKLNTRTTPNGTNRASLICQQSQSAWVRNKAVLVREWGRNTKARHSPLRKDTRSEGSAECKRDD
jgi:hypothetical protein